MSALPTDLEVLERLIVDNDDLLALEEAIGRFNIFDALGVARAEIRHSNFLAWLLDPDESHGQGELFLKAVLMDLVRYARRAGFDPPISAVDLDGFDLQGVEVRREWRNIDLLVACRAPRFVIAVENKMHSSEKQEKLQRYEDAVARAFPGHPGLYVFLNPDGDDAPDEDWMPYSYGALHDTLDRACRTNRSAVGEDVLVCVNHYLHLLRGRFMQDPKIDELCRRIYRNHKAALDLIFERAAVGSFDVVAKIADAIRAQNGSWTIVREGKRKVQFLPEGWTRILPPISQSEAAGGRAWVRLEYLLLDDQLQFRAFVGPTTDVDVRKRVVIRLLQDPREFGFSTFFKKAGPKDTWTRLCTEVLASWSEDEEPETQPLLDVAQKHLDSLSHQLGGVAAALIQALAAG
jgi:hypothetical protein